MELFELTKNNEDFIRKIKEVDPDYFEKLKKGQTPEFFVLACSDSRVSPTSITQMPLGEMFVHRNIGNQVDVHDESFTASLYYALVHLKVKKIIIQGHTNCGGVKAACGGTKEPELVGWLSKLSLKLNTNDRDCSLDLDALAKENLLNQLENLKNHPVYEQYGEGILLLGALFHVESGELEWIDPPDPTT